MAALREMRRVCVDGGIVAIRDADYATMVGHPEPPCGGLDRWRTIYSTVARSNNAEPNAGKPGYSPPQHSSTHTACMS